MPSTATVRRVGRSLQVPIAVATVWFVLYTALEVAGLAFYPEQSGVGYLFSARHLSRPLGWLYVLSMLGFLVGVAVYGYLFVSRN